MKRKRFEILIGPRAGAEFDRLRAQVPGLDAAVGKVLARLERFPGSAPPDRYRGRWSKIRRKAIVGKTGYVLRYRLHVRAELIEVFSIRHQKQRPPR